ncbi:transporter permease [Geoglobus ahangari]|uniref:hypothetical protein n=1 Tax=Geoglobus ahangari TaxID=113653 RepID=UPI0012EB64F5|nr:hypothetical protein [Geoglobus ahangari]
MFIDFRAITSVFQLDVSVSGGEAFLASVLLSQIVNNVPAAILMSDVSGDYAAIAAGVDVGGSGLLIASFANLIAYRMVGDGRFLRVYHSYSIPFVLVSSLLIYHFVF